MNYEERKQEAVNRAINEGYTVGVSCIDEKFFDLITPTGMRHYLPAFCAEESHAWELAYLFILSYRYQH